MTMRNVQRSPRGVARDSSTTARLSNRLGWFSIGLGLAEVIAPGALSKVIGVRNQPKNRTILRLYGLRELAAGVGILAQPRQAGWLWARVAGDAVDISSLLSATGNRRNNKGKIAFATASVIGVTAADIYCAQQLSSGRQRGAGADQGRVVRTIIVGRSAEDVYNFWHNFENLPRFMTYLQSVRYTGDRRTHWVAKGPAGARLEWDAETVMEESNRTSSWRSVEGSPIENSGSVRFERAPGDRGTLVRVEIDVSRNPGAAALGKLLKIDLGRRVAHDLRNLKQVLEIGEVTQSEASIHEGMHPAQPEPVHQY
jgi:uncharacterized membrane protein